MKLLEALLHALCIAIAVIGAIGLAAYTAAALAIVKAGEWMGEDSDETD